MLLSFFAKKKKELKATKCVQRLLCNGQRFY